VFHWQVVSRRRIWESADGGDAGTITMNGMIIFGKAAISGVRRASDHIFGGHGSLDDRKSVHQSRRRERKPEAGEEAEVFDAQSDSGSPVADCTSTCAHLTVGETLPEAAPAAGPLHGQDRSGREPMTMRKELQDLVNRCAAEAAHVGVDQDD